MFFCAERLQLGDDGGNGVDYVMWCRRPAKHVCFACRKALRKPIVIGPHFDLIVSASAEMKWTASPCSAVLFVAMERLLP